MKLFKAISFFFGFSFKVRLLILKRENIKDVIKIYKLSTFHHITNFKEKRS